MTCFNEWGILTHCRLLSHHTSHRRGSDWRSALTVSNCTAFICRQHMRGHLLWTNVSLVHWWSIMSNLLSLFLMIILHNVHFHYVVQFHLICLSSSPSGTQSCTFISFTVNYIHSPPHIVIAGDTYLWNTQMTRQSEGQCGFQRCVPERKQSVFIRHGFYHLLTCSSI